MRATIGQSSPKPQPQNRVKGLWIFDVKSCRIPHPCLLFRCPQGSFQSSARNFYLSSFLFSLSNFIIFKYFTFKRELFLLYTKRKFISTPLLCYKKNFFPFVPPPQKIKNKTFGNFFFALSKQGFFRHHISWSNGSYNNK